MDIDQAFEQLHEESGGFPAVYYSKPLLQIILEGKGEIKAAYQERTDDINQFTIWCVTEKTVEKFGFNALNVEVTSRAIQEIKEIRKEYMLSTHDRQPEPKLKRIMLQFSDSFDAIDAPEGAKVIQRFNELAIAL